MPATMAGFRFGQTRAEVAAACEKAGHQVFTFDANKKPVRSTVAAADSLACTGEVQKTIFEPFFVSLDFCASGTLCEVTLVLHKEEERLNAANQAAQAQRADQILVKKYGEPGEIEGSMDHLANARACIEERKDVKMRRFWTWPHEGRLILAYMCKKSAGDERGASSVLYQSWEMVVRRLVERLEMERNY